MPLKGKAGHQPDYVFLFCVALLTLFGLLILSSASSDIAKIKFNDTYYYLKHQVIYGLSLGVAGFLIASRVHFRRFEKLALALLFLNILALVAVFTPLGYSFKGASRWLGLGPFSIQPAEILKITFVIYLGLWLSNKKINRQTSFWEGYLPFLFICGLLAFLILVQPATTTAIIIMAGGLIVYFVSGARLAYVVGAILLGILALALVVYFTPYRFERVMGFFHPERVSIESNGYHLNQALIAIGAGGPWGVGFGKSTTKFKYLPEPIGDSIFAVIAEEFGFFGALILLGIFITLILRGFSIARNSRDQFGKLIAAGLTSIIAIQTFIHVAAISGLLPLTGVTLPFISYGGTSLAVFLTMAGIIVNISKYT
jgi:cell division protein FtsW